MLLADPQTSGGLLVACAPDTVTEVLSIFLQQGFERLGDRRGDRGPATRRCRLSGAPRRAFCSGIG